MTGVTRLARRLVWLAVFVFATAAAGPWLAPNEPTTQFADRTYAPPMRVRVWHDGSLRAPFVYRQVLTNRLSRVYDVDTSAPVALRWFRHGLVSIDDAHGPLLLLGGDQLGRDTFSRLLNGARWSLGVALAGLAGALILGVLIGGLAGALGRRTDAVLMWGADFVMALPGAYLVLVLRGMLSPVLSDWQVFMVLSLLLAASTWPHVARGVRAILSTERGRDYAEAARAAGAGRWRLIANLLPATRGFILVEVVLLLPALLIAEATISYLGLGFRDGSASWGTMLTDASNVNLLTEAPWLFAPAVAIVMVTLAAQLAHPRQDIHRAGDGRPLSPAGF